MVIVVGVHSQQLVNKLLVFQGAHLGHVDFGVHHAADDSGLQDGGAEARGGRQPLERRPFHRFFVVDVSGGVDGIDRRGAREQPVREEVRVISGRAGGGDGGGSLAPPDVQGGEFHALRRRDGRPGTLRGHRQSIRVLTTVTEESTGTDEGENHQHITQQKRQSSNAVQPETLSLSTSPP